MGTRRVIADPRSWPDAMQGTAIRRAAGAADVWPRKPVSGSGLTNLTSPIFPTRVIALTPDTTAYTFTMFQQPGMPDALFEAQHASLTREFEHIRSRFTHRS